jgi:hypothetical protein
MQGPVIPNLTGNLTNTEMDVFHSAVNLVSSAAALGKWKFTAGRGNQFIKGCKDLLFGISGLAHIADMGELAEQSATVMPSEFKSSTPKMSALPKDIPTFLVWAGKFVSWERRVVGGHLHNYRTATEADLITLYKIILAGIACDSQVPYGKQGNTRRDVDEKLKEAEQMVLNMIIDRGLLDAIGNVHQINWF